MLLRFAVACAVAMLVGPPDASARDRYQVLAPNAVAEVPEFSVVVRRLGIS